MRSMMGTETLVQKRTLKVTVVAVSARLQVTVTVDSTHYQVPVDTITAYIQVGYPEGLPAMNATVGAWLSRAGSIASTSVAYDETAVAWVVTDRFSPEDLPGLGPGALSVEAAEIYESSGSASLVIGAEPYHFIAIVFVAVFAFS